MLQKIKSENFDIYTNEIVHPKVFSELYNKEKILINFKTKVTTSTHHPFATFLVKNRCLVSVEEGDWIIIRAVKENKKFEFITKILKWGKFAIPKIMIKNLSIKNHKEILFEIVKESKKNIIKKDFIDLTKIKESIKIIYRKDNYITLVKKYKIPITLPRFIEITPELIEVCFLIHGDGHYQYKLYFVNKDFGLHKFVMQKFEKIFRIPKDLWKARLLFNNQSDQKIAKEKWKKDLDLDEEQFYPSISRCVLKTSNLGNLRIVIDKTIVSNAFRYILNQLTRFNKKHALYALNGLLYAEGGARKNKQGLHKITLSFSQKEKEMFQDILNHAGICNLFITDQGSRFTIRNWKNIYEFFRIFFENNIVPFDKHTARCLNTLKGFLNYSFTKTMYKYLKILNQKPNFTLKEIIKITNNRSESTLNTLRKPQYTKFIKIEGRGVNKNPLMISITKEGKYFIKLIEQIKEAYNEKCKSKQHKEKEEYKGTVGIWNHQCKQTIRPNIFHSFRPYQKRSKSKEDFSLWDSRVILVN